jgi:hypothetical protein
MEIKLKHVIEDVDRHGNVRIYVRVPGRTKVRIRARPGTEEFMTAYHAATGNDSHSPPQAREAKRGSFRYVCIHYYNSPSFRRLDQSTKNWQRRALDKLG